ncbi:MAG: hypothetical protein QF721_05255 [Verrucomicrobiota bacterium]|nr:hypothetical protein [Verrucomicrobiota bacterium]
MKRVLFESLTTAVAALGLVSANAESVLKAHFAGIDNLAKRDDAKTLRSVWELKQTKAFRNEALDKLAKQLGGGNAEREAAVRKLLPDLGMGEMFLRISPGDDRPDIALITAMNKKRGGLWTQTLRRLAKQRGGEPLEQFVAGYTGWRVDYDNERTHGFGYADGWLLFGSGQGTLNHLKKAAERIADTGRPFPADTENDLSLTVDANALPGVIRNLLANAASVIRITSRLKEDNFYSKAVVEFDEPLPANAPDWEIPTRTITEPLASFTAARGVGLAVARPILSPLGLDATNDQFYAWSQARTKFQSFFSVKVDDPRATIAGLAKRADDFRKPGGQGEKFIGQIEHNPKKPAITWGNVPLFAPYVTVGNSDDNGYLVAGVFPPDPIKKPIPKAMLDEFTGKDRLVYYNWEITGQRLEKWNLLIQFAAILSNRREQLVNNTSGIAFLTALVPKLGNTITDAVNDSNRLTITRKSHLGLSALELALLTRWIDNPRFPTPTLEWPPVPEKKRTPKPKKPAKPADKK